jgi:small-conductance mechanosensitive channel
MRFLFRSEAENLPGRHEQRRRLAGRLRRVWCLVVLALMIVSSETFLFSQGPSANTVDSSKIIQFLDQTIGWYRQLAVQQQIATEPDDLVAVYDNRQIADQVVRLAFDFARVEADSLAKQGGGGSQNQSAPSPQYQSLRQLQSQLDKQIQDTQAELDSLRQKLPTAAASKRKGLEVQVAELQGELELANARRDAMRSMVEFASGTTANGLGATGLRAQIEALAGSVPAALTSASNTGQAGASSSNSQLNSAAALATNKPEISGLWDLAANVFALSGKVQTIDTAIEQTAALAKSSRQIRGPLVDRLKGLSDMGDGLAKQADAANQSELARERQQLDALAAQFKQVSTAVIPLSKQDILLDFYQRNLTGWRDAVRTQYRTELRNLGLRLGSLAVVLGILFGASELWRRTIYRYVRDPRRRYQFLLMRRFVLWVLTAVIIAFAFASRLGSIVTFAGLLTAGVAVALQNVILSIVGYFFLIGKFGIRVGDRVQIGGVRGEVVDIGLVRLHLMELGGGGPDTPTGRIVAFSNSTVFQPTAGLFKQIPGTNFLWHEITLTLSPEADYSSIKERLLGAVNAVLADFREEMERQNREMERTVIFASGNGLGPKIQLHFTSAGIEAIIRFPVDLQKAAEMDERVTREVFNALDREPKLKLAGTGSPSIRLRTDLSTSEAIS